VIQNGNHEEFKVEIIFKDEFERESEGEYTRDITQESGTPYIVKGSDFGPKAKSVRVSNLTTNVITEISRDEDIKIC
jgi:hypothetical protein